MEIEKKKGAYRIHQQAYLENLLESYPLPEKVKYILGQVKPPEEEEEGT